MQEEFEETEGELGIYKFLDVNKYTKEELLEKNNLVYDMLLIEKSKNTEELEKNMDEVIKAIKNSKELMERIIKITMLPTFGERKTKELIKKLYKNEGSDNMLQVTRMLNNELRLKHKEGIREGILKVARNLLKKKADISEIKELTGLTEEEIMNIKI